MKSREGYVETEWGSVWYVVYGEKSDQPPLLALHGGPGFTHDYLLPLAELATDRQVIFYDQLGTGNSDRPIAISLWNKDRYVEELKIVCDQLELRKFHLLGNSWGAMLASSYMEKYPEETKDVVSLILADPFISGDSWFADAEIHISKLPKKHCEVIARARKTYNFDSAEFYAATDFYNKRHVCRLDPKPKEMLESESKMNWQIYNTMWGIAEFIGTGNLRNEDISPFLKTIKKPVLYIVGRYDEPRPESIKEFADETPNSQMKIFENSSHMPQLEEREAYLEFMREYLESFD